MLSKNFLRGILRQLLALVACRMCAVFLSLCEIPARSCLLQLESSHQMTQLFIEIFPSPSEGEHLHLFSSTLFLSMDMV